MWTCLMRDLDDSEGRSEGYLKQRACGMSIWSGIDVVGELIV